MAQELSLERRKVIMRMGITLLTIKISLFFFVLLLFSASLFTSCHAGRPFKSMDKLAKEVEVSEKTDQEEAWKETTSSSSTTAEEELAEANIIQERLLRANAKDYGRYDPAPALVRPPSKLIPN